MLKQEALVLAVYGIIIIWAGLSFMTDNMIMLMAASSVMILFSGINLIISLKEKKNNDKQHDGPV